MNKERELLIHALDRLKHINFEDDHLTNDFTQTIQKYLAQPEQTEQEPVATKLESHQFTAFHVSADDFKKLQKLPTGTKIYTAPPKREPLSEATINYYLERLGSHFKWDDGFEAGVKWAEKAHGIGGVDDE